MIADLPTLNNLMLMDTDQLMQSSSVTYVAQRPIMPQPMQPVHNPFQFKYENSSTLKDGVEMERDHHTSPLTSLERVVNSCLSSKFNGIQRYKRVLGIFMKISCQADCVIQAFWGVTINDFHKSISVRNMNIVDEIFDKSFLSGSHLQSENLIHLPSQTDYHYQLETPDFLESKLGSVPRTVYPLVIIITLDKGLEENISEHDIVAMAIIIHVKDKICKMGSQILFQYLKRKAGGIFQLKNLYVENTSSPDDKKHEQSDQSPNSFDYSPPDCIICQSKQISLALLPCRHTCVCESCFMKLEDRCPMCRSKITSYFRISNDETSSPE
ncbi:Cell growth regulator with RING finger domain protein 1 [Nymphon striatum]|nr:Cell growth regulator with RING finger domain protein 1 [Nymphon striatum]